MAIALLDSLSGVIRVPRSFYYAASIGGLVLLLLVASQLLVSHPFGLPVHEYVVGVEHSNIMPTLVSLSVNKTRSLLREQDMVIKEYISQFGEQDRNRKVTRNGSERVAPDDPLTGNRNDARKTSNPTLEVAPSVDSGSCDLYHGKWIYDPSGPLYRKNTCPILTATQDCQGNGRPDKDYENWRWKPHQCDLPRFDARKFHELMRGKTLAFVGDSVARNQMESLLCILWQIEEPRNRGNRHMQQWHFKSTNTTIIRIWSSWLVRTTYEPLQSVPEGIIKVYLDTPDESFMESLPGFDVVVLSSGHWFAKKSIYVLNGTIVGGQAWRPVKRHHKMKINNIKAFGISVETSLTAIVTHPGYRGLTVLRTYSPDHYEGGAWNSGGSCTGMVKPANKLVRNGFTNAMHEKQVFGYKQAAQKARNGSKLRLMDITEIMGYRSDGHPGPYRNPDANKAIMRGQPAPQDCLHWCMPGPVDVWNEILLEIIQREFQGV